jgi:hypothetical protein
MTSPRQHAPKASAPGNDRCTPPDPHRRPPPLQPSPAYKRPPCLPEKIHPIHSTLPDILLSPLALPIDLAGAGRAPRAPRVPGDWNIAPTSRRSRAAEKDLLRRRDTPPSPLLPLCCTSVAALAPAGLGESVVVRKTTSPMRTASMIKF